MITIATAAPLDYSILSKRQGLAELLDPVMNVVIEGIVDLIDTLRASGVIKFNI